MSDAGQLSCCVTVEWMNASRSVLRKIVYKNGVLRLVRNNTREIFLTIGSGTSATTKLSVREVSVHKRFMSEGKASIEFRAERVVVLISNAPPASLLGFLKMMYVKMSGQEEETAKMGPRERLLARRPGPDDEISPLTTQELSAAKRKANVPDATPPGVKRPLGDRGSNNAQPASAKRLCVADHVLSAEQRTVLEAVMQGGNVFFTGSAGTGKSFLLRRLIAALPPDVTMATASTGVAACLIGGTTLHSFAGMGSGTAPLARCIELANRPNARAAWKRCKHLVIDEISMVDGEFFEKLESVARSVRGSDKPFGGIQVVLSGDFLQLAPVRKTGAPGHVNPACRFAFQAPAWRRCGLRCFELRSVHRQAEKDFVDLLQSARLGVVTEAQADVLRATADRAVERNGVLATRLCSHTADADAVNQTQLDLLSGAAREFNSEDSSPELRAQLDAQLPVLSQVRLKVGAQVMLVRNSDVGSGLVNGARGVVESFNDQGLPVVRFLCAEPLVIKRERFVIKCPSGGVLSRHQVPLKLAWAFSIHKSQGLTLDCVEMSLSRVFEPGQAYVALSRAKSLNTLRVLDFEPRQVWADPAVLSFQRKLRAHLAATTLVAIPRPPLHRSESLKSLTMGNKLHRSNSIKSLPGDVAKYSALLKSKGR